MSDGWNIALLGATGAAGEALMATLSERQFATGELTLLASEHSAGETVRFAGRSLRVMDAADFDWSAVQLAFFAAGSEASQRYADEAASSGCLVIDLSDRFALEPDVPLVIPDVNPQVLSDYRNRNIVSVADSSVSQLLCAIKPLADSAGVGRLHITSLLAAAAHGKAAVDSLAGESARLLNGLPAEAPFFGYQLAFNLLPQCSDEEGSVAAERRLVDQTRKVLQDDGMPIAVSVVQAPVFYGNAQVVHIDTLRPLLVDEARAIWHQEEDIALCAEDRLPTPVGDASGSAQLSIGCVRNDYGVPETLQFWSVVDNVRHGALMAVKTAEKLVQEYYY